MSHYFELIIYTSSMEEYAGRVIDQIDQKGLVSVRLFRENCVVTQNKIVKSLERLQRDLKDVIIIDNSETAFMLDKDNAILIKSFFDNPNDIELSVLTPFLKFLSKVPDIRPISARLKEFVKTSVIIPIDQDVTDENIESSRTNLVKKKTFKRLNSLKIELDGKLSKDFGKMPKGEGEMNSEVIDYRGFYSAQLRRESIC